MNRHLPDSRVTFALSRSLLSEQTVEMVTVYVVAGVRLVSRSRRAMVKYEH